MKLSFVIPCYRSENTIETVVQEIRDTVATRTGTDYEIVLVNDCSPDGVWQVIKRLAANDNHIKGICLAKNFGQLFQTLPILGLIAGVILCLVTHGYCTVIFPLTMMAES